MPQLTKVVSDTIQALRLDVDSSVVDSKGLDEDNTHVKFTVRKKIAYDSFVFFDIERVVKEGEDYIKISAKVVEGNETLKQFPAKEFKGLDDAKSYISQILEEAREMIKSESLTLKEKVEALKFFLEVDKRYQNPDGTFKKMTCPDNPDEESKFCGCIRYFMSQGKSLDSAKRLCAYIYRKKYGG